MISYKPLWRTLLEMEMKKTDLKDALNLSTATLAKMSKNEYVALSVIDKICDYLKCSVENVIVHIQGNGKKDGE